MLGDMIAGVAAAVAVASLTSVLSLSFWHGQIGNMSGGLACALSYQQWTALAKLVKASFDCVCCAQGHLTGRQKSTLT